MESPIIIKRNNSKDYQTINSSKQTKWPNLDRSDSNSSYCSEKNKIIRLLNLDNLKQKNITKKISKLTETNNDKKIIFSNSRLKNLQILSTESTLKNLGKSTLDVNKIFGNINKQKKEKEDFGKVPNEQFFSFKNEYIIKFAKIAEYYNNFNKNSQLISENRRENFKEIFIKIKKILKNQTNVFFDYKPNINKKDLKLESEDIKSGFYKYKTRKNLALPKIFTTQNEEGKDLNNMEKNDNNNIHENETDDPIDSRKKEIISKWYDMCSLINKFLTLIFTELKESKETIRKLNQKIKEGEIRLGNNNKEIESMKSFLNKYEVNSKIYLKIKNEKEIEKMKSIFNKKENEYILTNFRLKTEINNLTSLLEENQKYFNKSKELEKRIDLEKKKNEEIKSIYSQELNEKNIESVIKAENEEVLNNKIKELENTIEEIKSDKDNYKKKDIENQMKTNNLLMVINEKNENIKMQNEEIEWYINEYSKLNKNYLDTRKDLSNLENLLMTKMKEKENNKESNEQGLSNDKKNEKENKINENDKNIDKDKDDNSDKENTFLEDMFKME